MAASAIPDLPAPLLLFHLLEAGPVAVFCDFDGTIVAIADNPDAITEPPDLGVRLAALAGRLGGSLAVVSGRSIDDLQHFLGPEALHWAGSHGADVRTAACETLASAQAMPAPVVDALGAFAAVEGLHDEVKAHGVALHYRGNPLPAERARQFASDLAAAHGFVIKEGRAVIALVWPGAEKGSAVGLLANRPPSAGATPVFIGDDITDEDGVAAFARLGGFGIAVGERPSDSARYALATVSEVHAWLAL